MGYLIDNWPLIVILIVVISGIGFGVYKFISLPTEEQANLIKEWLLYAVTEAEKELGSGTGQIKLRYVYDMFLAKFPWLSRIVPFALFCNWVDEVLKDMRDMLENNIDIGNFVFKDDE